MDKYIDREGLIAWLKHIPLIDLSDGRGLCRVIMEDDFKKAIKKMPKGIIADIAPVQEWISAKNSLPNEPMRCLVYTKRGEYFGYEITYYNQGFYTQYAEVIYWMPLPDHPKGE